MSLTQAQKDRICKLRAALHEAKKFRAKYESAWNDYALYYPGRQDRPSIGANDPPFVNLLLSTVQVAVAASTVEDPAFEAIPRTPKMAGYQPIVETVLDAAWEQNEVQEEFVLALTDRFVIGDGWLKTTWERVEEPPEHADQALVDEMLRRVQMVAAVRGLEPGQIPSRVQIENFIKDKSTQLTSNRPVVRRIDYRSVWVDSENISMKDIRWICQRAWHSLESVQNNDAFVASARKNIKTSQVLRTGDVPEVSGPNQDEESDILERVAVYEFYDIEQRELFMFAEGSEEYELLLEPTPCEDELGYPHPFTRIPCIPIPNSFYSIGFVEVCIPLQSELNDQRLMTAEGRRASIPKPLVRKKHSDDLKEWLENGELGTVGEVEEDDVDLKDIIFWAAQPNISPVLFQHGQELLMDLDRQVGISSMERGVGLPGASTATEVNAITGYISARARSFMRGTKVAMEEVARRILVLMQNNMTQTDYVWLQNEIGTDFPPPSNGKEIYQDQKHKRLAYPVTGIDLGGEWKLKIRVDTGTADGPANRQQKAQQFLQAMMPFVTAGTANIPEVMKYVLRNGFGITNPEIYMAPTPAVQAPPTGQPGGMASPGGSNATAVGQGATGAGLPQGMEALMAQAGQMGGGQ